MFKNLRFKVYGATTHSSVTVHRCDGDDRTRRCTSVIEPAVIPATIAERVALLEAQVAELMRKT